jgi:hypothetical protein
MSLDRTQEVSSMDDFFWEEVERSRKLTPEQRFMRTLHLIDRQHEIEVAEIRKEFPDADDNRLRPILFERRRARQREGTGF